MPKMRMERDAMTPNTQALQRLHGGIVSDAPNWDCPGCMGGDKWPVSESVWRCPVCDTEYFDTDESDGAVMAGDR